MDSDRLRAFLLSLPRVVETMQWGANLVFWTGEKSLGGKMFVLIDLDEPRKTAPIGSSAPKPSLILSYSAGPERFAELVEREGFAPAPYLARAHWIAAERWDVFTPAEWRTELTAAYRRTLEKLPRKTRAALGL